MLGSQRGAPARVAWTKVGGGSQSPRGLWRPCLHHRQLATRMLWDVATWCSPDAFNPALCKRKCTQSTCLHPRPGLLCCSASVGPPTGGGSLKAPTLQTLS